MSNVNVSKRTRGFLPIGRLIGWAGPSASLLAVMLLVGCGRHAESSASAPDAGQSSAASTSSASASTAAPSPSDAVASAIAGRLAREAASRPSGTPKAEDVLTAIAKNGVPLEQQAQHLAAPIGAR
jgi:hypothetical protein